MALGRRTVIIAATQSNLTDDPGFLRLLVERAVQWCSKPGDRASPCRAVPAQRQAARLPQRLRAAHPQYPCRHAEVAGDAESGRDVQRPALHPRSVREEGARPDADGDVRGRRLHAQGARDHRSAVRHQRLQEPRFRVGGTARHRVGGMAESVAHPDGRPLSQHRRLLRTCPAGRADRQPGGAHRRPSSSRWASRNPRGRRYRERVDVPRAVWRSQGTRAQRGAAGDERRPPGAEGGDRPAFPRRELQQVPGTFRSRSGQDGGSGTTRGTRGRPPRNLRGDDTRPDDSDGGSSGVMLGTDPSGGSAAA